MSKREVKNLAASVHDRLVNLAKVIEEEAEFVFTKYGLERFLYRVSQTVYRTTFILKGAALLDVWNPKDHRRTRDADFLGEITYTSSELEQVVREICQTEVESDGLRYLTETVEANEIRKTSHYTGYRVTMIAMLGNAKIPIQIDVGFGDAVTPEPMELEYPTLLEQPSPHLWAYPKETVVAEKLEAMVSIGMENTRFKDIYDIIILQREFEFDGPLLSKAVSATFKRRGTTVLEDEVHPFGSTYCSEPINQTRWVAFLNKIATAAVTENLCDAIGELSRFCWPLIQSLKDDTILTGTWKPNSCWEYIALHFKRNMPRK